MSEKNEKREENVGPTNKGANTKGKAKEMCSISQGKEAIYYPLNNFTIIDQIQTFHIYQILQNSTGQTVARVPYS